ncbi:MAG: NifB/NifX family molybdenum-iron cluster-binding protein [Leptonema sp. (in: bacteria)]
MKIAITTKEYKSIVGHAGRCSKFLIYEIQNNEISNVFKKELPEEYVFHNFFHNQKASTNTPHPLDDIDIFITASSGQGFVNRMALRGKRVMITNEKDPETAVKKFLKNELEELEPLDHH